MNYYEYDWEAECVDITEIQFDPAVETWLINNE